ncbi:putative ORFan [Cotonvirus japonicus]|uniref:ORFan n=1 Tax=Cotonvirus japonicus TaxID=2811091 RepID=A0ABM7NTM7_9VIRU|nr:putative ORFan [Cotonvirus japonicus]BCS83525.1 putative ORFan [Cotonvirus japonicus]
MEFLYDYLKSFFVTEIKSKNNLDHSAQENQHLLNEIAHQNYVIDIMNKDYNILQKHHEELQREIIKLKILNQQNQYI